MEELENNQIRADKWAEMEIGDLVNQRDIILDKIALLNASQQSITVFNIVCALQIALQDVDYLLDLKTNPTPSTTSTNQFIGM